MVLTKSGPQRYSGSRDNHVAADCTFRNWPGQRVLCLPNGSMVIATLTGPFLRAKDGVR